MKLARADALTRPKAVGDDDEQVPAGVDGRGACSVNWVRRCEGFLPGEEL